MASPQLTSLFQKVESALETVFHTAQDWSLLGPLWRDAGHIIGWKPLIDKTPYWIDFLPMPEPPNFSALLEGGGTSLGGMIITNEPLIDKQQVRELTEIFQKNPAAVRMQKQTISRLLTRLHGNHHAHHPGDDNAHRAEHEKDRNHLALLTKALTTAFPDIKPQSKEITALKLKSGVGRAEKEAFLVLQRLSNQYAPETTDRTLLQQVRHALAQIPLEQTKAVIKPQESFFNKLPWQLLLSGAMLAKPVVDLGSFAYTQWQPAPPKTPVQEQVIGDKQTLAEKSEKGSLYLGAVSLAIFMTLLKRGRENGGVEKALKVSSGAGHFGTEFFMLVANFMSAAEQYPYLADMLLQAWDAINEQITENASDFAVGGRATDLAKSLSEHLPTTNQSVKNNAELGLSVILSVAATHSINSALEMIAPGISVGLTAAMAGYTALKTGHAVKNAIKKSPPSEEKTAVASPAAPSLMVKAKNILSTAKVAVTRAINPSRIGQSVAATALSVFANLSFFAPPAQTPVSPKSPTTPTTETITPPQAQKILDFLESPAGQDLKIAQGFGGAGLLTNPSYTPSNNASFIEETKRITNLPTENVEQARKNLGLHTKAVYDRLTEITKISVHLYFNRQYRENGQNTPQMIIDTLGDLKNAAQKQKSQGESSSEHASASNLLSPLQNSR